MESLAKKIMDVAAYRKYTKSSLRTRYINKIDRIKYRVALKRENGYGIKISHSILVDIICDWIDSREPIRSFNNLLTEWLNMEAPIYLEYLGNQCNRFEILCKDKNGKKAKINLFAKCENRTFPYLAISNNQKEVYYNYMPSIEVMYENSSYAEYSKHMKYG